MCRRLNHHRSPTPPPGVDQLLFCPRILFPTYFSSLHSINQFNPLVGVNTYERFVPLAPPSNRCGFADSTRPDDEEYRHRPSPHRTVAWVVPYQTELFRT